MSNVRVAMGSTALLLLEFACGPDEVPPQPLGEYTEGPPVASDDDGGADETGGAPQRVCAVIPSDEAQIEGSTYRWHCSGEMEGSVKAKIQVDLSGPLIELLEALDVSVDDFEYTLNYIENTGWPLQEHFGPWVGDSFEDPAVIACCENDYDYPHTPPADDPGAEHGWACSIDCLDQSCRSAVRQLRDFAEGKYRPLLRVLPQICGLDEDEPCYYDQLRDLANYIANRTDECVGAFSTQLPSTDLFPFRYGGELDIDTFVATNTDPVDDNYPSELWPSLSNIAVVAECGIEGWELPPEVPEECSSSLDNDDEDPFGASPGAGFPGLDTFAVSVGSFTLDGPVYLGVEADGSAELKSLDTNNCDTELCSHASVFVESHSVRLGDFVARAPELLTFSSGAYELPLTDFRVMLNTTAETSLQPTGSGEAFEFAAGSLDFVVSAKIYGVPLAISVTNATAWTGGIRWISESVYDLDLGSLRFEHNGPLGQPWALDLALGPLIAQEHAPRAAFISTVVGNRVYMDASATSDGDGDALTYTWFVDNERAGTGPLLRLPRAPDTVHTVSLVVRDSTGRDSTLTQLYPLPAP